MKNSKKEALLRGTSALSASLFALMLVGTATANANVGIINRQLGTTSYITEKNGDQNQDTTYFKSEFNSVAELEAAKHAMAIAIQQEGSVLLKNNNKVLPLNTQEGTVTVWGLNSLFPTMGGLVGSGVEPNTDAGQTSVGLIDALGMKGFQLNGAMLGFYGPQYDSVRKSSFFGAEIPGHSLTPSFWPTYETSDRFMIGELPVDKYPQEVLDSAKGTTAIVILTRDSTEACDYAVTMKDPSGDSYETPLSLSKNEKDLIKLAKENSNGKLIVLLDTDAVMEVEELKQNPDVDAILWTGLPGMYGFEGVADLLAGNAVPSGHLADTYAVSCLSAPAMVNFGVYTYDNASIVPGSPLTGDDKGDWYVAESQGIYVGYKYYETRYEDSILGQGNATAAAGSSDGAAWNYANEVSYPFGYGLSYTTFSQELKSIDLKVGETSKAVVTVTNTGDMAGKEVVQLYAQAPYTAGGLEKAAIQLVNFAKTDVLEPGQSVDVTIEFDAAYIASYDDKAVKADGTMGAWTLDAGDYYFAVGNGAHAALNNVLAAKLGSTENLIPTVDEEIIAANAIAVNVADKDIETYSVNVENALQDCDLNNYIEGSVEYTTRSDWTKGWEPVTGITATDDMLVGLQNRVSPLQENSDYEVEWGAQNGLTIASMLTFDDQGQYTGTVDYDDPLWDQLMAQVSMEEAIQFLENGTDEYDAVPSLSIGNVYMNDGPNGFVKDQVPGYAAKWDASMKDEPTYTTGDEECANYTMAEMPTEPVCASTFNQELILREAELLGEDGLWANVSGITAPGVNLHVAVFCARSHEYYSEDAMLTNRMANAYCTGTGNKGTFTCIKHYAMNHQENNRSGISDFFNEQGARENELRAFQGAVSANNATGLMTGFNRVGTTYSGAHSGLLKQILRDEWGYKGWVLTDMVNGADYMNWRDNIYAGGGCTLSTSQTYSDAKIGSMADAKNLEMIKKDSAFQHEMKEAVKHFMYTFANSNAMNGVSVDTKVVHVITWWQKAIVAVDVVLGLISAVLLALYLKTAAKNNKNA